MRLKAWRRDFSKVTSYSQPVVRFDHRKTFPWHQDLIIRLLVQELAINFCAWLVVSSTSTSLRKVPSTSGTLAPATLC